jgi:hypothetical protein
MPGRRYKTGLDGRMLKQKGIKRAGVETMGLGERMLKQKGIKRPGVEIKQVWAEECGNKRD